MAVAGATTAPLVVVTADPFTNTTSAHSTAVEPDSYSWGSTLVEAAQVGRFYDGGASDIGWGTSTNSGSTWTRGALPGITKFRSGPYDRVSDPSVAYDAKHGVWMIVSLALKESPQLSAPAVVVNRSTDGIHWNPATTVATSGDMDKNWVVCDNWSQSPYYGHCYVEWDGGSSNLIRMNTSTDGGKTWGSSRATVDFADGIGGQPLVRPNGSVVVPFDSANQSAIRWTLSANGGASWSASKLAVSVQDHAVAGDLRASSLPSAEMDGAGRIYLVWQDCRFRAFCSAQRHRRQQARSDRDDVDGSGPHSDRSHLEHRRPLHARNRG